ncbi:MAG TPA: hypothetical protein VEX41_07260, partial [Candidatus Eisenbacteria bacterium]|nr:hypothetical protein [Candidatus Eisenbacteria bacterium]
MSRHLVNRAAVAAMTAVLLFASVAAVSGAVWTDQADYSPGSVVTISGDSLSGATYVEGNTVDVAVTGPVSAAYPGGWTASCFATVTAAGTWSCQITLSSDPDVAVGAYSYTATQKDPQGST